MAPSRVFSAISRNSLYVLIFLIPLFFLPITAEWLEFNKQYLLYATVTVGSLAWILAVLVERTLVVKRTPLDLPVLLLGLVLLVSALFSKDRIASFFGISGAAAWGFIPALFYFLLFFLITQHIVSERQIRRLLGFLVAGALIAAAYYWIRVFDLVSMPNISPAWNTVSAVNSRFGMTLIVPLLIAFQRLVDGVRGRSYGNTVRLVLWSGTSAIFIATIISLGFRTVMVGSAIGLGLFLLASFTRFASTRTFVVSAGFALWLLVVLFAVFGTPSLFTVKTPVEVSLSNRISLETTWGTFKEGTGRMLLGSGPGTFGYDFSAHRPQSFNENFVWSVRFNTPSSEILHQLAGVGLIGAAIWILLILVALGTFRVVASGRKDGEPRVIPPLFAALGSAWLLCLTLLFLIPFGTVLWVYFFVLLGLLARTGELYGPQKSREFVRAYGSSPQWSLAASFGAMVLIAGLALLGLYLGRYYGADIAYAKGTRALAANQGELAMSSFGRALRLNPWRFEYNIGAAKAAFSLASLESRASQPDQGKMAQFISAAVSQARFAAQGNPRSASAWETLAGIYVQVRTLTPDATKWALEAYGTAIALEPTNPALYFARGALYRDEKKIAEAKADFEKSLSLKRNYVPAYLALSQIAEEEKDMDKAIELAEKAVQFGRGDIDVAFNLARLYYNRNQGDDLNNAENIFKAILARNPNHSNARFTLAAVYERKGDIGRALEAYRKVAELNPENQAVRAKIAALTGGQTTAE